MKIRNIEEKDYKRCLEIYNYYVKNTCFTLEYDELSLQEFTSRIEKIKREFPYLVCEDDNKVVGYAYLSKFNERKGYNKTCDLSIYLDNNFKGKGYGKELVTCIEVLAKSLGKQNIMAIITSKNESSVKFHTKMGYKLVTKFEGIGEKFDEKLDIIYMQKTL